MSDAMTIREYLEETGQEMMLLEPASFDQAIVGLLEGAGVPTTLCYSREKVIELLMEEDGMDREDAEEYFSFNIAGAYIGESTPLFLTTTQELMLQ